MIWHIFSGGELKNPEAFEIGSEDKIICADRGFAHIKHTKIIPDLIIGDFDSYSGKLPDNIEILRSVPEKDDTDTMLAVRTAISRGAEKIRIYGALGGRFDHAFANIQTLKFAHDNGCEAEIISEDNIIMLRSQGIHTFEKRENWYFSVFAYSEKLEIKSMSGVKYLVENFTITNSFPIGVSNEFIADYANLHISKGTALVILSQK